jgi:hypothetical protein
MKIIGSTMADAFFASYPCIRTTALVAPWVRSANRGFGAAFLLGAALVALLVGELAGTLGGVLAGALAGGAEAAGAAVPSGVAVPHPLATSTNATASSFRFTVSQPPHGRTPPGRRR